MSLYFIHYCTRKPEHSTAALTTNACSCVVLIVEGRGITAPVRNRGFGHTGNNLPSGFQKPKLVRFEAEFFFFFWMERDQTEGEFVETQGIKPEGEVV